MDIDGHRNFSGPRSQEGTGPALVCRVEAFARCSARSRVLPRTPGASALELPAKNLNGVRRLGLRTLRPRPHSFCIEAGLTAEPHILSRSLARMSRTVSC